jgi:hypothetical protein
MEHTETCYNGTTDNAENDTGKIMSKVLVWFWALLAILVTTQRILK